MQAQYNFPYSTPNSVVPDLDDPPFIVRAACEALATPNLSGAALMTGMINAMEVTCQDCLQLPFEQCKACCSLAMFV